MKKNIGIVGYGNVGKEVEKILHNHHEYNLIAIFSRRNNITSEFNTKIDNLNNAQNYKNKIDIMIMCGGSLKDITWQSPLMLEHFDIIDAYDVHSKLTEYKINLQKVAKKYNHTAIFAAGWDPGFLSIIRALCDAFIEDANCQTFWGKGVSQGHSEVLKNIAGVKSAIQYTIPNQELIKNFKKDYDFKVLQNQKHVRECYVCLADNASKEKVEKEIKLTENYFKDQTVKLHFVSDEVIQKLKLKPSHAGLVLATGKNKEQQVKFTVSMKNNPKFTAQILVAYLKCFKKLAYNVYSVLDIPVGYLCNNHNDL